MNQACGNIENRTYMWAVSCKEDQLTARGGTAGPHDGILYGKPFTNSEKEKVQPVNQESKTQVALNCIFKRELLCASKRMQLHNKNS